MTPAIVFWKFGSPLGLHRDSIGTPTPKVGGHLGVWGFIPSHSRTLPGTWDLTPMLPSWLAPLQTFALVTNPRLGLQQLPYNDRCYAQSQGGGVWIDYHHTPTTHYNLLTFHVLNISKLYLKLTRTCGH